MVSAGELVVSIIGDMTSLSTTLANATKDIGSFSSKFDAVGQQMSKAGGAMTGLVTAPIIGAVASVGLMTNKAVDFDTNMRRVFTMLPGITQENMDKIKTQTMDLSKQFGVSLEEMSNAEYQALSSGIPEDNIFSFMQEANKLAIGGATDTETAVNALTSAVNAYGIENLSAAQASDIMFQGTKLGKSTVEELSQSMANVVPIAAANKISFEDINASLAAMTIQGTPTAQATTQLRGMISELTDKTSIAGQKFQELSGKTFADYIAQGGNVGGAIEILNGAVGKASYSQDQLNKATKEFADPTSKMSQALNAVTGKSFPEFLAGGGTMQEALKLIGVEGDTTTDKVSDLFSNVEAKTGSLQLSGEGAKLYAQNMEEMGKSAGATNEAFKQMDGPGKSMDKIKESIEILMVKIGDEFLPILVDTIVPFVTDTLIPALEACLPTIKLLAEGFNSLSPTMKLLIVGFIGLLAALGPVLIILGSVAGGISAIAALFASGGALAGAGAVISGLVAAIGTIAAPVLVVVGVVAVLYLAWTRDWGGIREKTQQAIDIIKSILNGLYSAATTIFNGIISIFNIWVNAWKAEWNLAQTILNAARSAVSSILQGLSSVISSIFNGIISIANGLLNSWRSNWNSIQSILSSARSAVSSILQGLSSVISSIFNGIVSIANSLLNNWRNNWNNIQAMLRTAQNAVNTILNAIRTAIQTVFNGIITVANTFLNSWRSNWNNIQAMITSARGTIQSILSQMLSAIQGVFNNIVNAANNLLNSWRVAWNNVYNTITGIRTNILNTLNNIVNDARSKVNDITNAISNGISGLPGKIAGYVSSFFNAGRNLMQGLLDGVNSKIEEIKKAVMDIIEWVANHLPRFSPAKMGPLRYLPKWDDVFYNPIKASVGKSMGVVTEGIGAISNIVNRSQVNNSYGGNTISIGPNTLSNGYDLQQVIAEINRLSSAQRRAKGVYL